MSTTPSPSDALKTREIKLLMPENPELQTKALQLSEKAKQFKVTDKESLEEAGRLITALSFFEKESESLFRPFVSSLDKLHKQALGLLKSFKDPATEAIDYLKTESRNWLIAEQKRHLAAKAAREKAEAEAAEAQRKADAEKARVASELEEAKRKQEEQAQRLLDEAFEAEELAKNETAPPAVRQFFADRSEKLLNEAVAASEKPGVSIPLPPLPAQFLPDILEAPPAGVPGLSTKKVWKWKCTDQTLVPETYKLLDTRQLDAAAVGSRPNIPGIEYFQSTEVARSRSRKEAF